MKIKKIIFFLILVLLFFYFFPVPKQKIEWGVNFSQKHSQLLGLDWKKNYLWLLDEFNFKNIKIITHWDLIESQKNVYFFDDLDWQLKEAEKRGANVILVIGLKTGRWPECHEPSWFWEEKKEFQEQEVLEYIQTIVLRYKKSPVILAWQVENEPFFPFGECPKIEKDFLKKEIALVRQLDPERKIIISDSGEGSFWITAARLGDIVGVTLYRKVYFEPLKIYLSYHFPASFYYFKKKFVNLLFQKDVWLLELQAEPWCKNLLYHCSPEEQKITMDFEKFKKVLNFVKKTGFKKIYFWGGEWWYWLKENNKTEIVDYLKEQLK